MSLLRSSVTRTRARVGCAVLGLPLVTLMCGCDVAAGLSSFDGAHLAIRDASPGMSGASGVSGSSAASGAAGAAGATGAVSGDTAGSTTGDTTGAPPGDDGGVDATMDDGSVDGSVEDVSPVKDSGGNAAPDANDAGRPNFFINPGFEVGGTSPWGTFTDNNGHQGLLQVSTAFVHSGKYSGWLSQRTATFQGFVQDVTSHIVTGQQYQMSAWVLVQPSPGDAGAMDADTAADADADVDAGPPPEVTAPINLTAQVACIQTDGTETTTYTPFVTNTANNLGWTQIAGVLSALTCSKLASVNLYVEGPPVGMDLYVDDLFVSTSP